MNALSQEKRETFREKPLQRAFVEIPILSNGSKELVKEIIEMSSEGLSFLMSEEDGHLIPKTVLKNLKIASNGHKKHINLAEVTYSKRTYDSEGISYRIGIKLINDDKQDFGVVKIKKPLEYRFRPRRYEANAIQLTKQVTFKKSGEKEWRGNLINFSKYGLAFETSESVNFLRMSDLLEDFKIFIGSKVVYRGKATVVKIVNQREKFIVRASFVDDFLDIEHVLSMELIEETKTEFESFFCGLTIMGAIEPDFKIEIADLRFFLENVRDKLNEIERKVEHEPFEQKMLIEKELLDSLASELYTTLDKFLIRLNEVAKEYSDERHNQHRYYFQQQLNHMFLMSPLALRIYKKPLGHAGDYEVVNQIFRNAYEGDSLFAKLLNRYNCNVPVATAHRNRVPYLLGKINDALNKANCINRKVNIASVGCSPAWEIQEFIKNDKRSNICKFTLIDFDEEALLYTQEKLMDLKARTNSKVQLEFFNMSVKQFVRETKRTIEIGKQDLIYSTGLFDYLTIFTCRRLIQIMCSNLNSPGTLVVSNIHSLNPHRCYMEYCGEWYLIHRNEKEMLGMIEGIDQYRRSFVEAEATGTNIFLNIEA